MARLIVCRDCTESDCTYCNMNILAVALERGYFNSLMREQHTVQIDSELVPVKHGHWEEDSICSVCGKKAIKKIIFCGETLWKDKYDYCPHCGAKMDEVLNAPLRNGKSMMELERLMDEVEDGKID